MSSNALVPVLQLVTLTGAALTAARLVRTGLRPRYPVFFSYFLFWVANSIWPLFLNGASHAYFWLWVCTEPINWIFYVLVVWELCGLVLEKYPGLVTLGRWAMYFAVVVSVIVSFLSIIPGIRRGGPQWQTTRYLLAIDRGVTFSLVIFLLLMMLVLKAYPVRLSRNVILHAVLFTVFFISNSIGSLFQNLFGTALYTAIDTALLGVSAACVLIWLVFLNPAGEGAPETAPRVVPQYEERVLHQLNALNATMLKVAGR
jgi:hypothetical protein